MRPLPALASALVALMLASLTVGAADIRVTDAFRDPQAMLVLLESRLPRLDAIVYHNRIGTLGERVARLIGAIRRLVDLGNTVVLIEHDPQVIAAADWVIDLGPGAGAQGGQLVAEGPPAAIAAHPASLTGAYLSGRLRVQAERAAREVRDGPWLHLRGAREHNLKGIDLALPLSGLTVIAGVSGSGKSTLVENVLVPAVSRALGREAEAPGPYDALEGAQMLADLVWIDQTPLAKSARSMPVTVTGAWDALRRLFAAQPEAAAHGFTAGSFSFNAGEGRCPACGGSGFEHVEMQFLADVYLRCPVCDGRRFRPEVLRVRLAGKNAADWLELTVDEALALLSRLPQGKAAAARLQPLVALGRLRRHLLLFAFLRGR